MFTALFCLCTRAEEAALRLTPDALAFVAATGQTSPPPRTVSLWLGDRSQHWRIEPKADWLTVAPREGDGSVGKMTAHFGLQTAGLKPGVYRTTAVVTLREQPEKRWEIPVSLNWLALDEVWDVGHRKQLFIDRRFIQRSENIALKVNPPLKLGQTLDPQGKPWHAGHISRVLEDQGRFLMYYGVERLRLAESGDGVHWTNVPAVNLKIDLGTIFIDPRDVPERRYKIFSARQFEGRPSEKFDPANGGITGYVSADGVHFTPTGRVLPMWIDNPLIPWWDERLGKYVVYGRAQASPGQPDERAHGPDNQRRVMRLETDDLMAPWPYDQRTPLTYHRYLLSNKHVPVVLLNDDQDYRWSDIYYNATTLYPDAEDVYLMFPAEFLHFKYGYHNQLKGRPGRKWEDYGLIEMQLAVSRDGIHWQRPERIPYVGIGRPDQWDRWLISPSPGFIRKGNDLLQYYTSSGHTHDSNIIRPEEYAQATPQAGGTGIVQQRIDGFVSADTDQRGGWLETPPLVFQGQKLRLNIDTGAAGFVQVELRDAQGHPLPGFELANCEEINGNFVDYYVQWKAGSDLARLAGHPLRLYFKLQRAKLYAFQFCPR